MSLAVIDYGAGNLRSVCKAFEFLQADVHIVTKPEEVEEAKALVLPGVGAFDDCAQTLNRMGMIEATRAFAATGKPFLGICVGYQILFDRSDEFGSQAPGAGLFEGPVVGFDPKTGVKVPQIGWNAVEQIRECPLYEGIPGGAYFYFVHSYYPQPKDEGIVATETEYGVRFASSVWRDNVFATQFHPEKSQAMGLRLLTNFLRIAGIRN